MSNDNAEKVKRCFFCQKRILDNKSLLCRRCLLQSKDIGETIIKSGAAIGVTVLTVLQILGKINTKEDK